jgi:hypothetical protein
VLDSYADLQRRANAFLADGCDAVATAGSSTGLEGDGGGGGGEGSNGGSAAYRFVTDFFEELDKAGLDNISIGGAILLCDPLTLFGMQAGSGSAQLLSLSLAAALEGRLMAALQEMPDCFLPAEGIRSVGRAPAHRLSGIGHGGLRVSIQQ